MRQKLITLDPTSFELASKKRNFSQWVRDQLRSEDNKRQEHKQRAAKKPKECVLQCGEPRILGSMYCTLHTARFGFNLVNQEEEE